MLDSISVPRSAVVKALVQWGYLTDENVSDDELTDAVSRYQSFNGLAADGVVGPRTVHQMTSPLRCGVPDFVGDDNCKWPQKRVTFSHSLVLPGLSESQVASCVERALAGWNSVCGIQLVAVNSESANIVAKSGRGRGVQLDGRGGTLAYSYMPCNVRSNHTLGQMYDADEQWDEGMGVGVPMHEIGHAIGIPHLPSGNLMQPYFDRRYLVPQAGDIAEAVKRYGTPQPASPPAGDAPRAEIAVIINGVRYTASGTMKVAP